MEHSSEGRPVKLRIGTGAGLALTSSVGATAIYLYPGSGIVGNSGIARSSGTMLLDSYIDITNAPSSNNVVVESYPEDGSSVGNYLQGLTIGTPSGISKGAQTAVVILRCVYSGTSVRDLNIDDFPKGGLELVNNGSACGSSVQILENLVINAAYVGTAPLLFTVATGGSGSGVGDINCYHCDIEHAACGDPMIDLEGGSANHLSSIRFYGTYVEASSCGSGNGNIDIKINNAYDILIDGLLGGGGSNGGDLVQIDGSSANTYQVHAINLNNQGTFTNTLNETVTTIPHAYAFTSYPYLSDYVLYGVLCSDGPPSGAPPYLSYNYPSCP